VFVTLWPVLRGFAARCLRPEEAEDAAQEACLRIFARASEFDRRRDALSWALGIAAFEIRTSRQRRRRRARRETPLGDDGAATAAARLAVEGRSPEEETVRRDLEQSLAEALDRLPGHDAATLLAYARGERPDLPGATFRKRVARALRRLRVLWRRYDSCR
jgi:RNA polymerase sigma factor (sigma-70 family)